MKKMLIVYYSVSNGNTKGITQQLQKATDADMISIETIEPYTGTYNEIVEQGQREEIQFDSAGGAELVTPEEKIVAWIDRIKE